MSNQQTAVEISNVSHRFGETVAVDDISLSIPRGATVGLIGPDGVGKSTLLSLIAGVKIIQQGRVEVFGKNMAEKSTREMLSHDIAFMPQGLGQNLYPTLSVYENVDFHARLFGLDAQERKQRIERLLQSTGLAPFPNRAAGNLSGGMKQKLSLCCALVHNPDLLILDEPTTGVDPLSRRQFWSLVEELRGERQNMTVLVATAYIDEAEGFEHLLAMDDGKLLANQKTQSLMAEFDVETLEDAYIQLLPTEKKPETGGLDITPFTPDKDAPPAIEAHGLTKRFGDFTAVDDVSFTIEKGEIFGFLGSNGCGKSTTMKMLTGLIERTEGSAELLGEPIDANTIETRMRVGYMSQAFSLYEELTVRQNLALHAKLYQLEGQAANKAVSKSLEQFELSEVADTAPASLSLGMRQRLQLAAACLHEPEVLILDEPTSGVDPGARDMFWQHLLNLSRDDKITIFISTHFMNEAARCDRISFMHRGKVLAVGTPEELTDNKHAENLEEAFIQYLLEEGQAQDRGRDQEQDQEQDQEATKEPDQKQQQTPAENASKQSPQPLPDAAMSDTQSAESIDTDAEKTDSIGYWFATIWTFAMREGKELLRDKIRLFFSFMGPIILMIMIGWSISFDVSDIPFAVHDRDQSSQSRQLIENFSGSHYFIQTAPVYSDQQTQQALKSSRAQLVIDIPADFGRDLIANRHPEVAFHIDGSLPFNASNVEGYVRSIMLEYNIMLAKQTGLPIDLTPPASVVPRFMYNQDFKSINAVVPSVIMLILMLVPSMMTALGVVREKEIGSISNLYASPASVVQYLLGKQLPYALMALINYLILVFMAVFIFKVPVKGSFIGMTLGAMLLAYVSTGLGLLVSSFVRTQVAALFTTAILTLIPTINYSGLLYPLSSLGSGAYLIGVGFPASWYQRISIGGFTKGLDASSLLTEYMALSAFAIVYISLACLFLKKQEK